jgi:glycosyltransferase involved in cell wall biosynthesis
MMGVENVAVSVITPTYLRPLHVEELVENLTAQTLPPTELILVDAAPPPDGATGTVVRVHERDVPFAICHRCAPRGTAVQRNVGLDLATAPYIAFVDDDVRLEPHFLETIMRHFEADTRRRVGGIVGYRTNAHLRPEDASRWRWYRRLHLLSTFEPGRYDRRCGYPINNNLQPPFSGVRRVDFMTTACAVWRREVFADGLRFDPFFTDFGVLEDAHLSLRAGRTW